MRILSHSRGDRKPEGMLRSWLGMTSPVILGAMGSGFISRSDDVPDPVCAITHLVRARRTSPWIIVVTFAPLHGLCPS